MAEEIQLTQAQRTLLITLWDIATHERRPTVIKNAYHPAAAALARRGLVRKIDRDFYRPLYELTEAGCEFCRKNQVETWPIRRHQG